MQRHKIIYPFIYGYTLNLIKTLLFILCFFTLPTLGAQEKKVTITVNNTSLNEVFAQLESQTKYSFAFVNSSFDASRKVSISAQNMDLGKVLDQLLKGTGYTYTIKNNRIFLSPAKVEKKEGEIINEKEVKKKPISSVKIETESKNASTLPQLVYGKKDINLQLPTSKTDSLDINKTIEILDFFADQRQIQSKTPRWAIKSNLLYDLTGSLSLGTEIKTGERYSLDLSVSYNPLGFKINKKLNYILIQPEMRYWLCEPFNGHFFGLNALYAHYNLVGLPLSDYMKKSRLQGDLYGVGLSYGYQWSLSKRWSIEGSFGVGYVHADYDRYSCKTCNDYIGHENRNYFAPTKAAVSLIYFIK